MENRNDPGKPTTVCKSYKHHLAERPLLGRSGHDGRRRGFDRSLMTPRLGRLTSQAAGCKLRRSRRSGGGAGRACCSRVVRSHIRRSGRNSDPTEDMLTDTARDLALSHDGQIRTALPQVFDFGIGMGTSDDVEAHIGCARLLDEISTFERIRNGADQPARAHDVSGLQQAGLSGIPGNHLDTATRLPTRPWSR
jgi:hypothetical protein